jgi:proline iminopeptidase
MTADLYPALEPYARGMLDVGDDNLVYWETCGDLDGKPALVVHGGPGSGCNSWHRRLFDPSVYRVVLFDQRACGRSTPHARDPNVELTTNTTHHLVEDMERLRASLEVDRWLLLGGSWGSTLALAYAERFPHRVSEIVVWGVTTGRRAEDDWLFRGGVAPLFPEQWDRLCAAVPEDMRDLDIVDAYARLLDDPDPDVRSHAARAWCTWESATPEWPPRVGLASRFADPDFAYAFARLVTHYVRHDVFLEDGILLRDIRLLDGIPGVLINGRFDLQAPLANAWTLHRAWSGTELVVVDGAGHAGDDSRITRELIRATDRFGVTSR